MKNVSSVRKKGDLKAQPKKKKNSRFRKRNIEDEPLKFVKLNDDGNFGFPSSATPSSIKMSGSVSADLGEDNVDNEPDTRKLVEAMNRKKKKSGGFQSMGLSHPVFKGVIRKGYKVPTPIQRKCMPVIMEGKDVVAMARTGSGKTAAFLIPMYEKLKVHNAQAGMRGIVLSPTRELALQTLKFTKELGKYTSLKIACILGGDSMDNQFAAIHANPDIMIATPGRFLHVLMEMDLKLGAVEYIVFDEADRLFEMGFAEQLREILSRLPESRQTLLFSATLPRLLADFARAGLSDPVLIRLDVDTKLSEQLKLAFLQCREEDKTAVLLHLLKNVLQPSEQTVIFVATKHHVEYLKELLSQGRHRVGVGVQARRPSLHLLAWPRATFGGQGEGLFVHRVGRVARAGRSGTAYSLVAVDEVSYVLDLHLYLGRPMNYASSKTTQSHDAVYGTIPQSIIDEHNDHIRTLHDGSDLDSMRKVCKNAMQQYLKSRPLASVESSKRVKEEVYDRLIHVHPVIATGELDMEEDKCKLLNSMRQYRPKSTIFEVKSHAKSANYQMMKAKRDQHSTAIRRNKLKQEHKLSNQIQELAEDERTKRQEMSSDADIQNTFVRIVAPKGCRDGFDYGKKEKRRRFGVKDDEFYIPYKSADANSEKELGVDNSGFDHQAASAMLDLTADDESQMRKSNSQLVWDRKKKKFVQQGSTDPNKKKVKTESGSLIPATYKTKKYQEWLEKNKVAHQDNDDDDDDDDDEKPHSWKSGNKFKGGRGGKSQGNARDGQPFNSRTKKNHLQKQGKGGAQRGSGRPERGTGRIQQGNQGLVRGSDRPQGSKRRPPKRELKTRDEIFKDRKRKAQVQSLQKGREMRKKQRNSQPKKRR
ncbi:PREDICTED: ATP-dependent RNA helicase DDX54-like [Priapulus caudatus]|uniref:RNA helicase n=1 Tax=Priapulus caudatus TaxID=37621 RepID=A0ABM1DQ71_PRICU|nr:PREDICTED: ATP-dependent RNA helicase DDX54-like [Priapulus caudatus]